MKNFAESLKYKNLVLEKKLILTSWVIILSITTFLLSMSGTFLVRSGILNSVHTFASCLLYTSDAADE